MRRFSFNERDQGGKQVNFTGQVSEFIVGTRFDQIPKEVVQIAKEFVLDSVGVQLIGSREPVSKIVREYVKAEGGTPEAGVIGGGFRTSVTHAAFLNGTSNHAPELEACGNFAGSNPLSIIPVALVLGEKLRVSGEKVLEAIIIGFEIQGKMGIATTPGSHNKGWCAIAVQGTMGAVVTAAKLLNLSVDQTRMALGIAASQAGGLMRQFGSMTHLLEGGFACRNGVTAALLAQKGLTSDKNILDGPSNLWEVMINEQGYDPEKMIKGLGGPFYFKSPGTSMKKYPCCFFTHRAVEALLQLVSEHGLSYEDVEQVKAGVTPFIKEALVGGADPRSGDMARFSLEHCLASALLEKEVAVDSFRDEKVQSPPLREARKKIELEVHPEWPSGRSALVIPVTVKLKGGKELTQKVEKLKGTMDLPLNRNEQMGRYRGFAKPFLSDSQIEESMECILNLEGVNDITKLMTAVTFGRKGSSA
jgi:2-methylcitrate dehydratase PrpD